MAISKALTKAEKLLGGAISIEGDLTVRIEDAAALRRSIEALVRMAVLGSGAERGSAQWLIRSCAPLMGAMPASIHELYMARGRGETRNDYTVPAVNLRSLTFHAARAIFRALEAADAQALLFEIARSEIGYTDQSPPEYAACVLAAAIAEGYRGPVFLQGDHFQVSAKRFRQEPQAEVEALRELIQTAITAGFFNIDIDSSTLVDLSQATIEAQQRSNYTLCAELAKFVRDHEPSEVTISIGGEIGEVGGHNSTEPELRAFMEGYDQCMAELSPGAPGLSKISIQTGTSHGGVVLPNGSIAQVSVDFDTLQRLSQVARSDFGMGGAVQHGASTLPVSAFSRFVEAGTCEVHLATNFQNILFEHLPDRLSEEIYRHLDENHADERKAGQTDEQFRYTARKQALGPFKRALWELPASQLNEIEAAWEDQFHLLFDRLNIHGTRADVERIIKAFAIAPDLAAYSGDSETPEDMADLAD